MACNAAMYITKAQKIIACNGSSSKAIKHLQQVQTEKKQLIVFQLVSLKARPFKPHKGNVDQKNVQAFSSFDRYNAQFDSNILETCSLEPGLEVVSGSLVRDQNRACVDLKSLHATRNEREMVDCHMTLSFKRRMMSLRI